MRLKLWNSVQWSAFALVLLAMGAAHAADMRIYDNVDLTNAAGEMPARLVPLPPEQTRITEGMLDVTRAPYNADNSGNIDAHAAIQNAIDDAYAANLIVFFPSGTYLCSDKLTCFQTNAQGFMGQRKFAHKLVGSTQGPRPVLKLMDGASLTYDDLSGAASSVDYPLFIQFAWRGKDRGSFEEAGERNYCSTFRGIDIDMGNNPKASALRMNSAQYSVIEDVHIYGADFACGVDGTPGGGGSMANLNVTGGQIGIQTMRTIPSIAGLTLKNQSKYGIQVGRSFGPLVVSGFSITAPASPASSYRAVYLKNGSTGDKAASGNLVMVDGSIEVPGSTGTAIYNHNQDVHLQNVYVKSANIIESGVKTAPSEILSGKANHWRHVQLYAFRCGTDNAVIMINGVCQGSANADHAYYEPLLPVTAPPPDLVSRHVWSETDFPSWEDADLISITDFGAIVENDPGSSFDNAPAIEAALLSATTVGSPNYGKTVFIPRGIFNVSSPIRVPPGAKLIGAGNSISQLDVSTSWQPTSATTVLLTANNPSAEIVLAHFAIVCNEATVAGSGFPNTTAQRFLRHATVKSGKTLWRNIQLDYRVLSHAGRQQTEPMMLITGNGGGRFYNLVNDNSGTQNWAKGYPAASFHKLKVHDTTLPLSFYQTNVEHLDQPTGQVNLENAQNVSIYALKAESLTHKKFGRRLVNATDVTDLQIFGTEGKYSNTDPEGYIVLNGRSKNVRIAIASHRLFDGARYGTNILSDTATGDAIPDGSTLALYAKGYK